MNTITLTGTTADGRKVIGYACGVCRKMFGDKGVADACCKCRHCGKATDPNTGPSGYHEECESAWRVQREADQLAKATKLDDWDGKVFWGDELYDDVGAAVEDMECECESDDEWPEWLYVAVPTKWQPQLDATDIVYDAYQPDDDTDVETMPGFKEFSAACEAFMASNPGWSSYLIDYTRAVRVTRPEEQA